METLNIQATTRLHQWWKPKASSLLAILYLVMLLTALPFQTALLLFLPSVATILGIGAFGHLINDWFDMEADQKAGKPNRLSTFSQKKKYLLLAGVLVVALAPWFVLPFDNFSIVLLVTEFSLLVMYAVPPVRLKERRIASILADGAYAYALPAVLAAHTFFLAAKQASNSFFLLALFLWQLLYGIRHYLNHLANDRLNDLQTGTTTLATRKGNAFIHQFIRRFLLPAEILCFAGFLFYPGSVVPLLPVLVVAVFILLSFLPLVLAVGRRYSFLSYRFSKTNLDSFYQNGWPFLPLFFLILNDWQYSLLLFGHLILFSSFCREALNTFRRYALRYGVYLPAVYLFVVPVVVFKRKFVRTGRENQDAKRHDKTTIQEHHQKNRSENKAAGNIAVANVNKAKYTETFITALLPKLKYNTYYLYGGELPVYDHEDRPFLSFRNSLQTLAAFLEAAGGLEKRHFQKQSIANYLQAKKIALVIAEFGPVGAKLVPITKDLGIPLIICFHGYDVYHKPTLEQVGAEYPLLFREAKKIIAVSKVMMERLQQLGAPPEKLVHLPAYVDLPLFPYTDHSRLPMRFLAVGRFAETKSPHLTLLAFHKVVQRLPDATLVMVGKGGGGELFEACVILAKALGLEEKICFKGVLSHEEVAREMQQARVFVQHSLTAPESGDSEGKPVAIMEAMACGLPVISTRHSGIAELIAHGVSGLLVEEYDIEAMANAMLLLAEDDTLAREMGKKGSEAIHTNPLIKNHVQLLEDLIDSSLA